ncbi:FAD dependent oxidoreductase [Metarhizium robertsii ARSEF 23]|uniref:FAD dependent oxidoreductase n=1 Tax=Metarhizium robertsii (strain ARSEF 23 / ATCC MYA-3075) TaxID=655844 RepID=A0A0B2XDD8_METRA|nr:FAD dependent oxidoreductase [Metarhizium robertsii ARSEF 23]KHO10750.1 FAD dependent oxidoreductase [Metarhizium robertsii ARSEF 23]
MSGRWGRRSEKGVIVEPVDLGGLGGLYRVRHPEMEMGMRERDVDVDVVPGLAAAIWSCLYSVETWTTRHLDIQMPLFPQPSPTNPRAVRDSCLENTAWYPTSNTRSGDAEATTATATATRR